MGAMGNFVCSLNVLNVAVFPGNIPARPRASELSATRLAENLQSQMLKLYGKFILEDGSGVNYSELKQDTALADYVNTASELQFIDLASLSRVELIAFCLNLYSALVIHASVVVGPYRARVPGSISRFFTYNAYNIGGYIFSLDDIEHGILRGNQPHPTSGRVFFEEQDPRRAFALPLADVDPRIHFALVCGAKSCPPIRVFTAQNLERGLELAAKNFCESSIVVEESRRRVTMSMIMYWYGGDFGSDEQSRLAAVARFCSPAVRASIEGLLAQGRVTLCYQPYDWSQNHS
eukprot:GILJ01004580.1.p1 GENE.GILJ01004580.1~~GILJ01004580.1.p1  ORF type:complete len:291 (-),score=26.34 GILJ01004580.1:220-1092(-)